MDYARCICPEGSRVAAFEDDWNGVLIRCEFVEEKERRSECNICQENNWREEEEVIGGFKLREKGWKLRQKLWNSTPGRFEAGTFQHSEHIAVIPHFKHLAGKSSSLNCIHIGESLNCHINGLSCYPIGFLYREVQLDFNPEIEVFFMLFDRYHSKYRRRSIKQHS